MAYEISEGATAGALYIPLTDLKKAEQRAHILLGLSVSVENLDKIIKIIRSSKTPDDAKKSILKTLQHTLK